MSRMSIRFQCLSCQQPIEVDDEWAGKLVACPYCRNTINAPLESNLTTAPEVPVASPLRDDDTQAGASPTSPAPVSYDAPNTLARVALVLALVVLVQLTVFVKITSSHSLELKMIQKRYLELQREGKSLIVASQQAMLELYGENETAPPNWMIGIFMIQLTMGGTWIAATICALIALRRAHRRNLAVWSLVISATVPAFYCCGGLMG